MIGFKSLLVFGALAVGALSSPRHMQEEDNSIVNWDQFQALLDTIDNTVLHGVLHSLGPKFKDGVFSKDRSAIEHVHSENPAMASKLVYLAQKRQASNSTTTSTSPAQSSQISSISSALSTLIVASTVPAATTVLVAPTAPPDASAVATSNGAVIFSTVGGGLVTLTSSNVDVSFTPSTSTHLYTTTAQDGQVQTSTSVVVVNAPMTGPTTAAGAAATTTGGPGLQNSASSFHATSGLIALASIIISVIAL